MKSGIHLRYLGVLGDKCTNFPKWPLFRIFIAILTSTVKESGPNMMCILTRPFGSLHFMKSGLHLRIVHIHGAKTTKNETCLGAFCSIILQPDHTDF